MFKINSYYIHKSIDFLGFLARFTIYHFIPMVSTTLMIISAFSGGLTLKIFIDYLYLVAFSSLLLAISTISGK